METVYIKDRQPGPSGRQFSAALLTASRGPYNIALGHIEVRQAPAQDPRTQGVDEAVAHAKATRKVYAAIRPMAAPLAMAALFEQTRIGPLQGVPSVLCWRLRVQLTGE